ncbi:ABC transporter ATP-binding protein, partial [Pseudomonas syringae]|nr:ABC transporter ATP-binding protein [Pseudomonas syringae]
NGAGKTTLLGSLCGEPRATNGSIIFEGKDITQWQTAKIMRGDIAIVPEGRRVFSRMTVEENLAMGGFFATRDQYQERLERVFTLFPRLKERRVQRSGTMSGGEQQMLAIGRALACKPNLLILDEPTEGIQPSVIKEIGAVIKQLAARGDMAILLVEQFYDFAAELADSYLVMSRGSIVKRGRGAEMEAEGVRGLV